MAKKNKRLCTSALYDELVMLNHCHVILLNKSTIDGQNNDEWNSPFIIDLAGRSIAEYWVPPAGDKPFWMLFERPKTLHSKAYIIDEMNKNNAKVIHVSYFEMIGFTKDIWTEEIEYSK